MKEPTQEEIKGWLNQNVTQFYKSKLEQAIEDIKDNWANGDFTGVTQEETIQKNSEAIGKVQQTAEILLMLDEMIDEDTED